MKTLQLQTCSQICNSAQWIDQVLISPTFNDQLLVWVLTLSGATGIKAVRKYVDEIDPRCWFHQHLMSSFFAWKYFAQLFTTCSCVCKGRSAQKLLVKCWQNWLQNGTAVDFSLLSETKFVTSVFGNQNANCVFQFSSTFLSVGCSSTLPFLCQKQCRLKGNFKWSTRYLRHFLVLRKKN